MKGKPWSVEEEKQLRELVDAKASLEVIMGKMHKAVDSVQKKCVRLGLEVEGGGAKKIKTPSSSSGLKLPAELPSIGEALKGLVEAKTPLSVIAKKLGVSEQSVRAKIRRLGLVVEEEQRKNVCSSSLVLPEELPSVEEQLKRLELEVVVRQIQQTTTSTELPSVDEEKQLREMVQEHKRLSEIAWVFR
jgi:hypothetical protein